MRDYFYIDSEKLRLAAARACLSFRKLARKADLAPETVTRIYKSSGNKAVTTETAGKLARALGVDVTEIIVKEG